MNDLNEILLWFSIVKNMISIYAVDSVGLLSFFFFLFGFVCRDLHITAILLLINWRGRNQCATDYLLLIADAFVSVLTGTIKCIAWWREIGFGFWMGWLAFMHVNVIFFEGFTPSLLFRLSKNLCDGFLFKHFLEI